MPQESSIHDEPSLPAVPRSPRCDKKAYAKEKTRCSSDRTSGSARIVSEIAWFVNYQQTVSDEDEFVLLLQLRILRLGLFQEGNVGVVTAVAPSAAADRNSEGQSEAGQTTAPP